MFISGTALFGSTSKAFAKLLKLIPMHVKMQQKKVLLWTVKVGEIKVDENELPHQDSKFLEQLLWNCN